MWTGALMGMILMMEFLNMLGSAPILALMAVLANPEQFLLDLRVLAPVLLVISLAFKVLITFAQTRFALVREYSIGKRLVEGYLHQPYSWLLNRHSAGLGKTILSEAR